MFYFSIFLYLSFHHTLYNSIFFKTHNGRTKWLQIMEVHFWVAFPSNPSFPQFHVNGIWNPFFFFFGLLLLLLLLKGVSGISASGIILQNLCFSSSVQNEIWQGLSPWICRLFNTLKHDKKAPSLMYDPRIKHKMCNTCHQASTKHQLFHTSLPCAWGM